MTRDVAQRFVEADRETRKHQQARAEMEKQVLELRRQLEEMRQAQGQGAGAPEAEVLPETASLAEELGVEAKTLQRVMNATVARQVGTLAQQLQAAQPTIAQTAERQRWEADLGAIEREIATSGIGADVALEADLGDGPKSYNAKNFAQRMYFNFENQLRGQGYGEKELANPVVRGYLVGEAVKATYAAALRARPRQAPEGGSGALGPARPPVPGGFQRSYPGGTGGPTGGASAAPRIVIGDGEGTAVTDYTRRMLDDLRGGDDRRQTRASFGR